ncbi:hypothetical protein RZS08_24345, partial [Arthrospira platensis SPKY1]|nr:hypothetical protein [Arthrospira platensis SPKY1]
MHAAQRYLGVGRRRVVAERIPRQAALLQSRFGAFLEPGFAAAENRQVAGREPFSHQFSQASGDPGDFRRHRGVAD